MKFAHEFKDALTREGFPAHWVESAIPYSQLKKCIKKVEKELKSLGLDSATLAQLYADSPDENEPTRELVGFEYDFEREKYLRPKLTLFVQLENGLAVDATLTPETRNYLEKLAAGQGRKLSTSTASDSLKDSLHDEQQQAEAEVEKRLDSVVFTPVGLSTIQRVEVPLTFDTEFFDVLHNDVMQLDTIQDSEKASLVSEITALSSDVSEMAKPHKFGKSDMYQWRQLFELYLDAAPFFSTREADGGARNSGTAAKQLAWFQDEVKKRSIVSSFKLSTSRKALDRFITINVTLLQNLSFQEINQKAVKKILKKFDKRTRLGATKSFPKLIQSDSIMSEDMAKAVCSQMNTDIVKKVPQLDDHLCPICFTIYWRPIKMLCGHIFCIRCTVLMQREQKKFCPLCRKDVILAADIRNIDADLGTWLKKYFPKEAKAKRIEIETAAGVEQYGEGYRHPSSYSCVIM